MPIVVTCPACQQKARVPEAMLGQTVKCPACEAAFPVPAEGAPPPTVEVVPEAPTRAPLPADADSLRAACAGSSVQLIAHCLYAAALALYLILLLFTFIGPLATGPGMGGRGVREPLLIFVVIGATLLLIVCGLLNIVGAAFCLLAPAARFARAFAIALLVLALLAFERFASVFGVLFGYFDDMYGRFQGAVMPFWLSNAITLWLVDVGRLVILALFWRSMSCILRDARGAALGKRLAIAGPIAQAFLVFAWIVISFLGATGQEIALLALFGMLGLQFFVVLAGIGLVARLRRRLKAALLQ
jgi:hypothetical protein